jgi:succinate-semialdehyde dehydrogenase/glutarate-semialdehyde dehydrogenase
LTDFDIPNQPKSLRPGTGWNAAVFVFTADIERGHSVARRIESGMEFVNHSTFTAPELPFGGIKNSGYGRELSEFGFGEFVNRKLIDVSPAGSPPPIG